MPVEGLFLNLFKFNLFDCCNEDICILLQKAGVYKTWESTLIDCIKIKLSEANDIQGGRMGGK